MGTVVGICWRKSTYSGISGACVEVGFRRKTAASGTSGASPVILVRDTKRRDGGSLSFTVGGWQAFTASLK
jgi:uncharacterized protein DUF397